MIVFFIFPHNLFVSYHTLNINFRYRNAGVGVHVYTTINEVSNTAFAMAGRRLDS